jgi:peroxygenase
VYVHNIHKNKHGSDTGTYDTEGRFIPQKFEDIFSKYSDGRDYITIWDMLKLMKGQRCIADPIGWGGAFFECEQCYRLLGVLCPNNLFRARYLHPVLASRRENIERGHPRDL